MCDLVRACPFQTFAMRSCAHTVGPMMIVTNLSARAIKENNGCNQLEALDDTSDRHNLHTTGKAYITRKHVQICAHAWLMTDSLMVNATRLNDTHPDGLLLLRHCQLAWSSPPR